MIQSITSGHHGRDKKLLAEAQQMLADSKAKIEFLRLRILKVRRNRQSNKVILRFCCLDIIRRIQSNRFFLILFTRWPMRMAIMVVVIWKHRWKIVSRSCSIDCVSKQLLLPVPKMWYEFYKIIKCPTRSNSKRSVFIFIFEFGENLLVLERWFCCRF